MSFEENNIVSLDAVRREREKVKKDLVDKIDALLKDWRESRREKDEQVAKNLARLEELVKAFDEAPEEDEELKNRVREFDRVLHYSAMAFEANENFAMEARLNQIREELHQVFEGYLEKR